MVMFESKRRDGRRSKFGVNSIKSYVYANTFKRNDIDVLSVLYSYRIREKVLILNCVNK